MLNFDMQAVGEKRLLQLNELDEIWLEAYENSRIYKEKAKKWHDKIIAKKDIQVGNQVLLFNLRLCLFPEKLKSRWTCPFTVTQVFPYGSVEIENGANEKFKVNGQRLKLYWENALEELKEKVFLQEPT